MSSPELDLSTATLEQLRQGGLVSEMSPSVLAEIASISRQNEEPPWEVIQFEFSEYLTEAGLDAAGLSLPPFENNPLNVAQFLFSTRKLSHESQYGLWTTLRGGIPLMQGPFDKATFLQWLAQVLADPTTKIVLMAKDGQPLEGDERDRVITEANRIITESKQGR